MKALFFQGGWKGHTPEETTALFAADLRGQGFDVEVSDSLACLDQPSALRAYDLVVPMWTMADPAEATKERLANLSEAVRAGVGLAGLHGGMGDAMRHSLDYQWMTGGLFLGHPHVGDFVVRVVDHDHPATAPLPYAFAYKSEQYYMAFEPSVDVLAVTDYCWDGMVVEMPVIWHKTWGAGRVFYSSLGHVAEEFERYPEARAMTVRGMVWAAEGRTAARDGNA